MAGGIGQSGFRFFFSAPGSAIYFEDCSLAWAVGFLATLQGRLTFDDLCQGSGLPHGGVRPFLQKSSHLIQLTLGPYVVRTWSRYRLELRGDETRGSTTTPDFFLLSLLLSSLELSDAKVYEPELRALLGTASHFCEVVSHARRPCLIIGIEEGVDKSLERVCVCVGGGGGERGSACLCVYLRVGER